MTDSVAIGNLGYESVGTERISDVELTTKQKYTLGAATVMASIPTLGLLGYPVYWGVKSLFRAKQLKRAQLEILETCRRRAEKERFVTDYRAETSVEPNSREADHHSLGIWKGFRHEWLRRVFGIFKVPHRVSELANGILGEKHTLEHSSWKAEMDLFAAQANGVDGDCMRPETYYAAMNSSDLFVDRGSVRIQWQDSSDGALRGISRIVHPVKIRLKDCDALSSEDLDKYLVVMRGFHLKTMGANGEEDGMWPYRFGMKLGEAKVEDGYLQFDVEINVGRGWTPNKGGIPKIEEKPYRDSLKFDLRVDFSLVGGQEGAVDFSRDTLTHRSYGRSPMKASEQAVLHGRAGYASASAAVTGFEFDFEQFRAGKKYEHLGRYLQGMTFGVKDGQYDKESGQLALKFATDVSVPKTVANTDVHYELHTAMVQTKEKASIMEPRSRKAWIYVPDNGAPWFSKWKKYGPIGSNRVASHVTHAQADAGFED